MGKIIKYNFSNDKLNKDIVKETEDYLRELKDKDPAAYHDLTLGAKAMEESLYALAGREDEIENPLGEFEKRRGDKINEELFNNLMESFKGL